MGCSAQGQKTPSPEQIRVFASSAYVQAGKKVAGALPIFKDMLKKADMEMTMTPKAACAAIKTWGERLVECGHVRTAHHKAGRKSKLSSQQVEILLQELRGWRKAGLTAPYASIERFCVDNPIAKKIKARAKVCTATVRRQLQAKLPGLKRVPLKPKALLTAAHKAARVAACKRLLRVPLKELEWVVWIDAKTLPVTLKQRYGWVDTSSTDPDDHLIEHPLGGKTVNATCQVKYYAAVNAKVGTIGLYFITGTSGMPAQRAGCNYKVRKITQPLQSILGSHHLSPPLQLQGCHV